MITEGQLRLISRYYAGRGREFAFLELAQEHLLEWMVREGLFAGAPEDVVFSVEWVAGLPWNPHRRPGRRQ